MWRKSKKTDPAHERRSTSDTLSVLMSHHAHSVVSLVHLGAHNRATAILCELMLADVAALTGDRGTVKDIFPPLARLARQWGGDGKMTAEKMLGCASSYDASIRDDELDVRPAMLAFFAAAFDGDEEAAVRVGDAVMADCRARGATHPGSFVHMVGLFGATLLASLSSELIHKSPGA